MGDKGEKISNAIKSFSYQNDNYNYSLGRNYPEPSAPDALTTCDNFVPHAPPPSYEEAQRQNQGAAAPYSSYTNSFNPVYGFPNPYHQHIQQQQIYQQQQQIQLNNATYNSRNNFPNPPVAGVSTAMPSGIAMNHYHNPTKILEFARGATVRNNINGAVLVPPPPPGVAPTAAQLAAMQGEQVLVKKKSKKFF